MNLRNFSTSLLKTDLIKETKAKELLTKHSSFLVAVTAIPNDSKAQILPYIIGKKSSHSPKALRWLTTVSAQTACNYTCIFYAEFPKKSCCRLDINGRLRYNINK